MSQDKIDTTGSGVRRLSALEALRKQAEGKAKQEDPAVVRARAIEALNKEMRAVSQFLGKIPVTLTSAWVDARPRKVDGLDGCERIEIRYQVNPDPAARITLLGDDIGRFEQILNRAATPPPPAPRRGRQVQGRRRRPRALHARRRRRLRALPHLM